MPNYTQIFDEAKNRFLSPNIKKPLYVQIPRINSSEEFALNIDKLLKKASVHDLSKGMSQDISEYEYKQIMQYIQQGLSSESQDVARVAKQYKTYVDSMLQYDKKNPPINGTTNICDDELIQNLYNDVCKKAEELSKLENPTFIDKLFGNNDERDKKIKTLKNEIRIALNQWNLEIHKKITYKAFSSVDITT